MPGSVVGAVAGGVVSGIAGNKAAKTQAAAADRASELQKEMYDQTRTDLEPFRKSGTAANQRLAYLMGLGDVAFDRDAIRQKYAEKYFGGAKDESATKTGNAFLDDSPYVLPQAYMNTFVPMKMHPQFLKPQTVEGDDGRQLRRPV